MPERTSSVASSPYTEALVTIRFIKGDEIAFQIATLDVLGRVPAVGEEVLVQDKLVTPPVQINGVVKKLVSGYYKDTALGIVIEVHLQ
jgi:hypothetical protein